MARFLQRGAALGTFAWLMVAALQAGSVVVSIAPLGYLVQKITSEAPMVIVQPGRSEETFEPTPSQMEALGKARVYFYLDFPFEQVLRKKLQAQNQALKMVNAGQNLTLLSMHGCCAGHEDKDPHVWMSPKAMTMIAQTMQTTLGPSDSAMIARTQGLVAQLQSLDEEIRAELAAYKGRTFVTYHPSFAYFARDYDLKQLAIENAGKSPSGKDLEALMAQCKELGITVIFAQPQFDTQGARVLAKSIGARIVAVDPLADDYPQMIRAFTRELIASFNPLS